MVNISLLNKYAVNYLSKYESTKNNLRRILKNKVSRMNLDKNDKILFYNSISSIILNLEKNNLIDDKRFANIKINNFIRQGKSEYYIKNILLKKGVEKEIIQVTLNQFNQDDPEWKFKSALIFAKKKKLGKFGKVNNKEKDIAKMSRAGFEYSLSKKILSYD